MTDTVTGTARRPPAALERSVTAAIRAGHAWSVRRRRPEAWLEVARMTGVIMRACGPGRGPDTPAALVAALRRPLREWLPGCDETVADLVVLDADGELGEDTYEIGCDYTVELLTGLEDPGARWLPGWSVHRAEQIEKAAFQALLAGSDEHYTRGRRFIVEHPAGDRTELTLARNRLGLPPLVAYEEIPVERRWRDRWWPCPVCRWPMRVRASQVRCDFPRHDAVFALTGAGALQPLGGVRRAPRAQTVDGAVCVDESVWRYFVVPGVVEVRLHDRIARIPGVHASLYPQKDVCDVAVWRDGAGSWEFTLDVKDYASARALARKLEDRPITAEWLVLPRYRRGQVAELRRLLPDVSVTTEDGIYQRIRRTATAPEVRDDR